jgi:hypothetical protein
MRILAVGTLSAAVVVLGACDAGDGRGTPLSAGQERAPETSEATEPEAREADGVRPPPRDRQGGGSGGATPVTVAEHTLGEARGFVVTASFEDDQVCVTATPQGEDGQRTTATAITDCAAPDRPLDLRVLTLGEDLALVAGVVTDPRAANVTLIDVTGEAVPDEADAAPLIELPRTEHRVFAAATSPDALTAIELADADGTVIGDRGIPSAAPVGRDAP